jgi:hypothetical protein
MSDGKVKGVVDIVILLDVSGSMQACIDAVKSSVSTFIEGLSSRDANDEAPIKDWRIKVCGYRDQKVNATDWFVDNPFVRDVPSVQAQIAAANLQASGGGDEPESLLDALYKLATIGEAGVQDTEDPYKWRVRGTSARTIIFFTDASFNQPMTLPEAAGGGIEDVLTLLMSNRIIVCGFCPEWEGYGLLGSLDGCQINLVARIADTPALTGLGKPGEEGRAAQRVAIEALRNKAGDPAAFTKIMEQLAKTIQKSATAEAAAC